MHPDLPCKRYDIIYADPPWDYDGKKQFDKKEFIGAAEFEYPTMKTEELKKIQIREISKDDCLLFMWSSNPHLKQAIELGEAWGFEYKTVAFVWDKMRHNPGYYTLSYCELCLVFKKGRIPAPRGSRCEKQLVSSPRGRHSQKPIEISHAIERMFPTQDKIELFARSKAEGWDAWGLDAPEACDAVHEIW